MTKLTVNNPSVCNNSYTGLRLMCRHNHAVTIKTRTTTARPATITTTMMAGVLLSSFPVSETARDSVWNYIACWLYYSLPSTSSSKRYVTVTASPNPALVFALIYLNEKGTLKCFLMKHANPTSKLYIKPGCK